MVVTAIAYIGLILILLILVAVSGLLFYARNYAAPVPPAIPGTIKIACVGDSITYGALVKNRIENCYPAQLEKLLGTGYSVRNFGINGHALQKSADKPYWSHKHFQASSEFRPDIVLIMLGTNDATEHNWKGIEAYAADYRELNSHYRSLPSHPIIYMLTPPTQFSVENCTRVIHTMNNDRLDAITEAIKKMAEEPPITAIKMNVIDINTATKNHPECFKFDGIHPDASGAKIIAEMVYASLTPNHNPMNTNI
jgi:acyl-CoA thioesterase I